MRWFFALISPYLYGMERKELKIFFIWPTFYRDRARFVSFSASGESAYFYSTPSPSVIIFFLHLFLMRLFSFCKFWNTSAKMTKKGQPISHILLLCQFSYCALSFKAYFHSTPSPTGFTTFIFIPRLLPQNATFIFILRLLLLRLFLFRTYSYSAYWSSFGRT